MAIDIKTIIFITGICHLIQLLVFIHQYRANKNIKGPGWWVMWSVAESLGFLLILLRSIPSLLPYVIVFQNIIILSGTIFVYIGLMWFFDRKVNFKIIIPVFASFVLLHLFYFFVINDITIRALLINIYLSAVGFLTALSLNKIKTPSIASTLNFNITIFTVHGGVFAYRAVMIILGTPATDVFAPTIFNFLQYFDALIMGLLWTFGFIIMLNQRLNSEISEAKTHFELIFNTSPDAAVITSLIDGRLVDCNESYTRITGHLKEDILGKTVGDINIWKNPDDRQELLRMIREKGFCENYEAGFRRKNGELFTGLLSARPVTLKGIPHLISVTRDISERIKSEQLISLKNEELQKINAEKDKFFSIISHDLRGPMGALMGLTDVLVDEKQKISPEQRNEVNVVLNYSTHNLFNLLENLLKWSQIQKGYIEFNPTMLILKNIVTECITILAESARNKAIEIVVKIPDEQIVFADTNILQAIIRNLVSNALKFSSEGSNITITTSTTEKNSVLVAVKDSGIGMNNEMMDNLFSIVSKSSRLGTSGEIGTGLGLVLTKEFVEKNGGKIWVESEEGKGSVFYFTIPCNAEPKES